MNIIIIFPKKEFAQKISGVLQRHGFHVCSVCVTGAQGILAMEQYETGLVISAIRYSDMNYRSVKENLPDSFEMIVLASQEQWEQYGEDDVSFLPVPFKVYDLIETVDDYICGLERRLKKEKKKPKKRNSRDQGLIMEAKERLMERNQWSEEKAHRYLQRSSMDCGRSLVETAEMILEMIGS